MKKAKRLAEKAKTRKPRVQPGSAKQGTVGKMELKYIPWSEVELEDLNPLLQRQFVVGQAVKCAYHTADKFFHDVINGRFFSKECLQFL